MKKALVIIILTIITTKSYAQCTSGNCNTGVGTYNYGWCIYTGEFKNSKPEGKGVMKYDDYTYAGHFINGLEDGEGVITKKNGTRENVTYSKGAKVVSELIGVSANDYKPIDVQNVSCLSGSCNTGFGTYQYPSGNKYAGIFNDRKREGKGIFYFANGDKYEGIFHDNEKTKGTYYYSTGAKYAGSYDSKGNEYNGTITSVTGMSIPYVNGKAIIPPAPKIPVGGYDSRGDTRAAAGPAQRMKMPCSVCFGTGKTSRTEDRSNYGGAQGGNREYYSSARVYSSCYRCHGSGVD